MQRKIKWFCLNCKLAGGGNFDPKERVKDLLAAVKDAHDVFAPAHCDGKDLWVGYDWEKNPSDRPL